MSESVRRSCVPACDHVTALARLRCPLARRNAFEFEPVSSQQALKHMAGLLCLRELQALPCSLNAAVDRCFDVSSAQLHPFSLLAAQGTSRTWPSASPSPYIGLKHVSMGKNDFLTPKAVRLVQPCAWRCVPCRYNHATAQGMPFADNSLAQQE